MSSLYDILNVRETATADEVKSAYRRLAKAYHPDLHGGDKTKEAAFKQLQEAYATLGDPERRFMYDLEQRSARRGKGRRRHR